MDFFKYQALYRVLIRELKSARAEEAKLADQYPLSKFLLYSAKLKDENKFAIATVIALKITLS